MADPTTLQTDPGGRYDVGAPTALVVADDKEAAGQAARALDLAGYAVRAPVGFAEAARDPGNYDGLDLILIEAATAAEPLLEIVLAGADTMARERALPVIATISEAQIDIAAA